MMKGSLRADRRAEVGAFEDLQTLLVVVVAITVLLGSTLFNWSVIARVDREQAVYDSAADVLRSIESWDRIRAYDDIDAYIPFFLIRQPELVVLVTTSQGRFEEQVRSDFHYNVTFDDVDIPDADQDRATGNYSKFQFGEPLPGKGVDTVVLRTHYTLVFLTKLVDDQKDTSTRHLCDVTVVVWA
jgi:hypothetical protein